MRNAIRALRTNLDFLILAICCLAIGIAAAWAIMPPIKKMMQGVPRSFAQQRPAIQIPVQPNRSVGVFRIGGEVSAPILVSKVEPAYTEEARKAKYSGTVLLSIVIGADGLPRNVHVIRPLGHGLDEKAIEAVMKWRFRPGMKGGQAVATQAQVEVNFRLL